MLKIYHNPQCKKSRAGLQFLKDSGTEFEIVEYLKKPLTGKQLESLLVKLNLSPREVLRTQEPEYKKSLKGRNFNTHEWIRIITENLKLLKRPIIESRYKAVIGDPVENIEPLIKNK